MDYVTGLGHRRNAASPLYQLAARPRPSLRIAIIEASPPAMPHASVLCDNAPALTESAVHTCRMVTFRREIRLWHETGVTQRAPLSATALSHIPDFTGSSPKRHVADRHAPGGKYPPRPG